MSKTMIFFDTARDPNSVPANNPSAFILEATFKNREPRKT